MSSRTGNLVIVVVVVVMHRTRLPVYRVGAVVVFAVSPSSLWSPAIASRQFSNMDMEVARNGGLQGAVKTEPGGP